MATIRKRTWGEGQTAWICTYADGAGRRRQKTFARRKDADAWLLKARTEVAAGIHSHDWRSETVAAAAEAWLQRSAAKGLERTTTRAYRSHVDLHINPRLGGERLSRLTTPRIERFCDELAAATTAATAARALSSLKAILREAQRRGAVAQNVARDVRVDLSKRRKERVQIPSKEDIKAVLAAAGPQWRPLFKIAVLTGLRSSELRALTWQDLDLDAGVLRVRRRADRWNELGDPKSAASRRDVPLGPAAVETLRTWRHECPKGQLDLVFPNMSGRIETLGNIWTRGLKPAQAKAGVKPFGMHQLRHVYASWLINQGLPPKRIQHLMGHSSITMTYDTYGHLLPAEDDRERIAAAERALLG